MVIDNPSIVFFGYVWNCTAARVWTRPSHCYKSVCEPLSHDSTSQFREHGLKWVRLVDDCEWMHAPVKENLFMGGSFCPKTPPTEKIFEHCYKRIRIINPLTMDWFLHFVYFQEHNFNRAELNNCKKIHVTTSFWTGWCRSSWKRDLSAKASLGIIWSNLRRLTCRHCALGLQHEAGKHTTDQWN